MDQQLYPFICEFARVDSLYIHTTLVRERMRTRMRAWVRASVLLASEWKGERCFVQRFTGLRALRMRS